MLCESAIIEGDAVIGVETVLHPLCKISAQRGFQVCLGERNVVEELSAVADSIVGHANLIQVGCLIDRSKVSLHVLEFYSVQFFGYFRSEISRQ